MNFYTFHKYQWMRILNIIHKSDVIHSFSSIMKIKFMSQLSLQTWHSLVNYLQGIRSWHPQLSRQTSQHSPQEPGWPTEAERINEDNKRTWKEKQKKNRITRTCTHVISLSRSLSFSRDSNTQLVIALPAINPIVTRISSAPNWIRQPTASPGASRPAAMVFLTRSRRANIRNVVELYSSLY